MTDTTEPEVNLGWAEGLAKTWLANRIQPRGSLNLAGALVQQLAKLRKFEEDAKWAIVAIREGHLDDAIGFLNRALWRSDGAMIGDTFVPSAIAQAERSAISKVCDWLDKLALEQEAHIYGSISAKIAAAFLPSKVEGDDDDGAGDDAGLPIAKCGTCGALVVDLPGDPGGRKLEPGLSPVVLLNGQHVMAKNFHRCRSQGTGEGG